MTFVHPVPVRYLEVDAQGVVFNAWYLAWFDDAMTAFLLHRGLPYADMIAAGFDVQLVRSEVDWRTGVGFGDRVGIAVSTARIGRTSFALDFEVRRDGTEVTCAGRTVYVVIATDGTGKREIPPLIAAALGEPTPLLPLSPAPAGISPDRTPPPRPGSGPPPGRATAGRSDAGAGPRERS